MRVGTTSFIYPGGWLYNVERLGPYFDDLELLFFEAEGAGAFPDAEECRGLAACKRQHGLSYSLHTPLAASLASENPARRAAGVNAVRRAIDAAALFEPEHYVLHVYLGDGESDPAPPRDLAAWRGRATDSLSALLAHGVAPRQLCVEALDYDFALIQPVVEALDLSIALDIGHWVRDGREELQELERYLPRTRLLQWHGTDARGRDHLSLRHYPADKARDLLSTLAERAYDGVLTLEVFQPEELASSTELLAGLWRELGLQQRLGPARFTRLTSAGAP
jgi:sugar phosphate isomerase/epimerase